jgi:DNA-binding MarR family transcriptional regulator
MRKPAPYVLEDNVGFVLRQVTQRHVALFQDMMPARLTPTQFSALVKLHDQGPVSQTQLGRLTAMDAATIKGVVDRLTRRALVALDRDPADGRMLIVSLTPAGAALVVQATRMAAAVTRATLSPLEPDEQATLLNLLRRLG